MLNTTLLEKLVLPLGIAAGSAILLLILRAVFLRILGRWTEKTVSRIDDTLVRIVRGPSVLWCIVIGLYLGIAISEMPPRYATYLNTAIHLLVILSITSAIANVSKPLMKHLLLRMDAPVPSSGLVYIIVKLAVYLFGILLAFSVLKIPIAPILTALGVGGLAVALAIKDTLENLFAGIYLLTDKSIRVGDFIRLDTGLEGNVEDVGWRTTRIRLPTNNLLFIPNAKLSQSNVINFSLPDQSIASTIEIVVALSNDPQKVEEILTETVSTNIGQIPGLLGTPEPSVQFQANQNAFEFTVRFFCAHFNIASSVQHQLKKRSYQRLRESGIKLPEYPVR